MKRRNKSVSKAMLLHFVVRAATGLGNFQLSLSYPVSGQAGHAVSLGQQKLWGKFEVVLPKFNKNHENAT